MSFEPFNKLVKLAARAFYDDVSTRGDHHSKSGKSDNRGLAVVVLDALTRRQWVREEDLAKDLKLHSKQLRRTLRFFEEEKLVSRYTRKETAKGAKMYNVALAATADGQPTGREGDEKIKLHTHSYCCLDYAQIYDVVRYRLHRMRKKLKDELESRNTVQEYVCPSCQRRYTAFDALQLISPGDESFHCESCRAELIVESDKFTAEEGEGDDKARKRRREKLRDILEKMEVQLKPLTDQLARLKDLTPPELGSLPAWELRARDVSRGENVDSITIDSCRSSQIQGFGGTQMQFLGETRVEVALSGVPGNENESKPDAEQERKIMPPWMIKQNMNLSKEHLGDSKDEVQMGNVTGGLSDDKTSKVDEKDERSIQDEYYRAYYAALYQRQQELEAAAQREQEQEYEDNNNASSDLHEIESDRQVGKKSKRDENKNDGDAGWVETPASGHAGKMYDLNVEASASGASGDEEDDIDWEDGM